MEKMHLGQIPVAGQIRQNGVACKRPTTCDCGLGKPLSVSCNAPFSRNRVPKKIWQITTPLLKIELDRGKTKFNETTEFGRREVWICTASASTSLQLSNFWTKYYIFITRFWRNYLVSHRTSFQLLNKKNFCKCQKLSHESELEKFMVLIWSYWGLLKFLMPFKFKS